MGRNFMTPNVDGYLAGNGLYIELSSGTGIDHEPIFGVTVLFDVDGEPKRYPEAGRDDLSQMFFDRSEAFAYANRLTGSSFKFE